MAVRSFDGTDDEIRMSGPVNLTGALSVALLVKRNVNTAYHLLWGNHNSSNVGIVNLEAASQAVDGSKLDFSIDSAGSTTSTITLVAADGWCLVGVNKAAGTTAIRFHKLAQASFATPSSMTHANGVSNLANPATQAGGTTRFGEYQDTDDFDGKIALAALWTASLADADFQALATNLNISDWTGHATPPARVWRLGDSSPTDLMGAGDSATINGTTVDTGDDPPGWTLSAGGTPTIPQLAVAPYRPA